MFSKLNSNVVEERDRYKSLQLFNLHAAAKAIKYINDICCFASHVICTHVTYIAKKDIKIGQAVIC